jgi:hypothetical protein
MKILFTIAVLSFAALVWAAVAIARHVRRSSARTAAQPASNAALSEAIDARLSELAGQPSKPRAAATADTEQDFSYFNRDAASSLSDKKPYGDATSTIQPATADRP